MTAKENKYNYVKKIDRDNYLPTIYCGT